MTSAWCATVLARTQTSATAGLATTSLVPADPVLGHQAIVGAWRGRIITPRRVIVAGAGACTRSHVRQEGGRGGAGDATGVTTRTGIIRRARE